MNIAPGFHTITPYLILNGVATFIEFVTDVFGAEVKERHDKPDGSVVHAEVLVGDSMIMMGEASDKFPTMTAGMYIYVEDCDATYALALKKGAMSVMEPAAQEYAARAAGIVDPTGNTWWLATPF